MQSCTSIVGSSSALNWSDPVTWDVTVKLERVSKHVLPQNRLSSLKYVSDPRISQYEQTEEIQRAKAVRSKLQQLHPWTAERLRIKAEVLEPFDFRVLVSGDGGGLSEPAHRSSHICLSYNWWSDQWLSPGLGEGFGLSPALREDVYHGKHGIPESNFPIADSMWNAFLAERETEMEGVWVDQLCIDQKNPDEVKNALLLMERIYRVARKVVVPLENVLLWSDEARTIVRHIQAINDVPMDQRKDWFSWVKSADLQTIGASAYALTKIEGSRWFRRVWCNHEMRMGNDFVFMIPVVERTTPDDYAEKVCIMKLDCKALFTLIAASRTMNIGTGLTHEEAMWQGYFEEVLSDYEQDQQPRVFMPAMVAAPGLDKFTPINEIARKAMVAQNAMTMSVMKTLRELCAYPTQHPRDMLHVLLDTVAPGLAYDKGAPSPSLAEISLITNVVALASGDLSPLVESASLRFWHENEITDLPHPLYSWAVSPISHVLSTRPHSPRRLVDVPSLKITNLGLQLRVMVTGASLTVRQTSDLPADFVQRYVPMVSDLLKLKKTAAREERLASTEQADGFNFAKEREGEVAVDPVYLRNFVDVMALAMSCGLDWMVDRAAELSQLGLFPRGVDLRAQKEALESPFQTADDGSVESAAHEQLLARWPACKDYVGFFAALVEFLIGPEWAHKSGEVDDNLRVSRCDSYSADGSTWMQLAVLPDNKTAGYYWLVRPAIIQMGARPDRVKTSRIDLREGGTWAVKAVSMRSLVDDTVDVLDDERAKSTSIWTNMVSNEEDENEVKRQAEQVVELKMISRSIRMFPSGEWQLPMFGKMACVHG